MKGSGVLRERCLSVCRVDESLSWLNTLLHSVRICHGDSVADWVVSFEGVVADRAVCLIVPLSLTHLRRIHWCPLTQSCSGRLRGVIGSSFDCLCLSDLMVLSLSCVGVMSASDSKTTDHPQIFTGRLMHITLRYGKYLSKCPIIWRFSTAWYGTVRYGSLLGGFPLGTVPGTWYFFSTTSVEVPCEPVPLPKRDV